MALKYNYIYATLKNAPLSIIIIILIIIIIVKSHEGGAFENVALKFFT